MIILRIVNRIFHAIDNRNIVYIKNKSNLGIATALNQAANLAIKEGYDFLLTMDQDSLPDENMISKMIESIQELNLNDIGIISPVHVNKYDTLKVEKEKISYKFDAMTSGNLLNLKLLVNWAVLMIIILSIMLM